MIVERIQNSIETKQRLLKEKKTIESILKVAEVIVESYKFGRKTLLCGNGGSAADAQHIAAELSGRFYYDRKPLYAEALHVNTSYITAVSNDYGYDIVYERMIEAAGRSGDVLIGISTSGNSPNILKAIIKANEIGMVTVGMTGETGGKMKSLCHHLINVPSNDTPRIQECHILIGHILCELIENQLFPKMQ